MGRPFGLDAATGDMTATSRTVATTESASAQGPEMRGQTCLG